MRDTEERQGCFGWCCLPYELLKLEARHATHSRHQVITDSPDAAESLSCGASLAQQAGQAGQVPRDS